MDDQQAFQSMMSTIVQASDGVHSDSGEWQALSAIAQRSATIAEFATAATSGIWTDGEDQSSWSIVQQAAALAATQDPHPALLTILGSFGQVQHPSHNGWAWDGLAQEGQALARQLTAPAPATP